jgi:hypothetical protein
MMPGHRQTTTGKKTVRMSSQIDKDKAIESFLRHAGELVHLSLVTDSGLLKLYGEEVVTAIAELERSDREGDVCLRCGGQCCRDIGCELYAPQFHQCPIYEFRPIACRLHFCHRFDAADRSLVLSLRDIFLDSLTAVESRTGEAFTALDSPPLAGYLPEFVAAVVPRIDEVRCGLLSPEYARRLILKEARKCRVGLK